MNFPSGFEVKMDLRAMNDRIRLGLVYRWYNLEQEIRQQTPGLTPAWIYDRTRGIASIAGVLAEVIHAVFRD
jgi:hypothetical protein